jgi:hypothetical protein
MLEWAEVWFADCVCKSHALRSGPRHVHLLQCCGHLQCDVWSLEHCSSQRSSIWSCSHIAAESRTRDLRWWWYDVLPCLFSYLCLLWCAGWGMGCLSGRRFVLLIASASLMPCAGGSVNNAVDIFNVTSGAWSTAALSVGRLNLAATSLPNQGLAIFAGGYGTCCHVYFRVFACCGVRVGEWDA